MTSEIIVFQPPEKKEVFLTKTERELLYEDLEKHSELDSHHFDAFYKMETEDLNSYISQSSISSMMFKYIINLVYPIVREIPKLNIKTYKSFIKKKKEKEKVIDDFFFNIQVETPIKGFTKKGKSFMLVPGVYYQIIGFKVPNNLKIISDNSIPDLMSVVNILNLTTMGHYGVKNFNRNTYTQQRRYFIKYSEKNDILGKTIFFRSNEQSLKIIEDIIEIYKNTQNYYETYYSSIYTNLKFHPFSGFREILNTKTIKTDTWEEYSLKKMQETNESKKIRDVYTGILSKYERRFKYEIWNNGIFDIFQKIKILGLSHSISKKIIDELITKNKNDKNIKIQEKQKSDKYLEFAKKKTIVLEKFNISDLNALSSSQRKIMELEYKKIKKLEESSKKLSETSVMVKELYDSIENNDYNSMRKYFNLIKNNIQANDLKKNIENREELLKDKNGLSIICPHMISKVDKILKSNKNPDKISNIRDYIISLYSLPDISLGYFCKICGALLAEQDEEKIVQFLNGVKVNSITDFDRRQSIIWKEVAYILSTFVKFKYSVNLKKIITSITESIKEEIGIIETKLSKIKTNNNDNISDLLKIYITIYVYAVVMHMIYLNYGKITFITRERRGGFKRVRFSNMDKILGGTNNYDNLDSKDVDSEDVESGDVESGDEKSPYIVGGEKIPVNKRKEKRVKRKIIKDDKKRLQNIFKTAIELIIKSKNSVLSRLSNISIDNIKPLLIKAYKWVLTLKINMQQEDKIIKTKSSAHFISVDPIYEYLWYVHSLKSFSKKEKQPSITDIKRYLGRSLKDIEEGFEEDKTIYEDAKNPGEWGDTKKSKYDYRSFEYLLEYTKEKIYKYDVVPMNEVITNFDKKYENLKKMADEIEKETIMKLNNPMIKFPVEIDFVYKYNEFKKSDINIANYYCPDGEKHNFNIFVFNKILPNGIINSKKKIEATKKEIKEWVFNDKFKEFQNYHLVDEKCSKCKIYMSKISKNKNLEDKIKKIEEINSFYDYFEIRCPEGNLHEYIYTKNNSSECSNCGFNIEKKKGHNNKYYNKYIKKYKKILDEMNEFDKNSLKEFKNITKIAKKTSEKFSEWKINNKFILELSRKTKIKYNILINLGLSENRKFENIEKELENPHINSSDKENILRNQYLRDYCLWFIRNYYSIKNYNFLLSIPDDLKKIIEDNRSHGIENMKKVLPDIYDNFNKKYSYYFRNIDSRKLSNFLLNYLCYSLCKILNETKNTKFSKLGKDFTMYCLNIIIKSERDVSKPLPINLIINKGETKDEDFKMVPDDEFYNISESEKSLEEFDELVDTSEGDDFSRTNLDLDMSEGMSDNFETNFIEK